MADEAQIAAIVLAAGRSSRMGAHKLLLPLGERPLVSYAVNAALRSAASQVIVVLGHDAGNVRKALPSGGYQAVVNERYAEGMASSLQAGLAAVATPAMGAIVLLADQPLLTSAVVNRIVAEAAAHPSDIAAATYGESRGHPVYFPLALFAELRAITGDEGGRSVIARHMDHLRRISIEPPQLGLDVDEPSVYERLVSDWPRYSRYVES